MITSMCDFTVFLKSVRSLLSHVYSSYADSRGGSDVSGDNPIPVAFICKYLHMMLVRLIL